MHVYWNEKSLMRVPSIYDQLNIYTDKGVFLSKLQAYLHIGGEVTDIAISSPPYAYSIVVTLPEDGYSVVLAHYKAFLKNPQPDKLRQIAKYLGFLGASAENTGYLMTIKEYGEPKTKKIQPKIKYDPYYPGHDTLAYTNEKVLKRFTEKVGIQPKTRPRKVKRIYELDINSFGASALALVLPEIKQQLEDIYSLRARIDDYFFKYYLDGFVNAFILKQTVKVREATPREEFTLEVFDGFVEKVWPKKIIYYDDEDSPTTAEIHYEYAPLYKEVKWAQNELKGLFYEKFNVVFSAHDTLAITEGKRDKSLLGVGLGKAKIENRWSLAFIQYWFPAKNRREQIFGFAKKGSKGRINLSYSQTTWERLLPF